MTNTLVIDTSYGSTVGVVGHAPIIEADSRTHVEKLQANIASACVRAGLRPRDLDRIVVGVGPAPFTGLRAGIVTAKALAFATGAQLLGCDVLTPQARMMRLRGGNVDAPGRMAQAMHLTLAVNDARRRQLYYALLGDGAWEGSLGLEGESGTSPDVPGARRADPHLLMPMDIDYPERIVERVNELLSDRIETQRPFVIDVIGHGTDRYAGSWPQLHGLGSTLDASVLEVGDVGLALFAEIAAGRSNRARTPDPVEPLYLRRPDVSVPNPLKTVLDTRVHDAGQHNSAPHGQNGSAAPVAGAVRKVDE